MKIHKFIHSKHFDQIINNINWDKIEQALTNFINRDDDKRWIEVNFQTDETLKEINKNLRNKDKTTDVLSWDLTTSDSQLDGIIGEIHISDKYVENKCLVKNLKIEEEIIFLVIHGFLHVLGYDHNSDDEELEMNKETLLILKQIGIDYSKKLI